MSFNRFVSVGKNKVIVNHQHFKKFIGGRLRRSQHPLAISNNFNQLSISADPKYKNDKFIKHSGGSLRIDANIPRTYTPDGALLIPTLKKKRPIKLYL